MGRARRVEVLKYGKTAAKCSLRDPLKLLKYGSQQAFDCRACCAAAVTRTHSSTM